MVDYPPRSGSESTGDASETQQAQRPQEQPSFEHRPVMIDEVVELATPLPAGTFLDATLGGGGHARAVLEANDGLDLLGVDRDPSALAAAAEHLAPVAERVRYHRGRFDSLPDDVVALSGFLFDLGVSSPQFDRADRGFSYRYDGPLDMRMDPDSPVSADDVVNGYDERRLADSIRRNSDERFASRIAKAIVASRPIATTAVLAEVVASAIPAPARRRGGHPAKRTFQAIRIEVNDELDILEPSLERVLDALVPGGRGMVITYHSGEDRITKDAFRRRTTPPHQPQGLPVEGPELDFAIVRPAVRRATDDELAANPRSSSARLRSIERVANDQGRAA